MARFRPNLTVILLYCSIAILTLLSSIWALDPAGNRQHSLWSAGILLSGCLIAAIGWTTPPTLWRRWWLITISGAIILNSMLAIRQFMIQQDSGLYWLGEPHLEAAGGYSIIETAAGLTLRGYGLMAHPNTLGGGLAVGILLLAFAKQLPAVRAVGITIGTVGLIVTFSRGAWLALICSVMLALVYVKVSAAPPIQNVSKQVSKKWPLLFLTTASVAIGIVLLNWPLVVARLQPESVAELRSLDERMAQLGDAAALLQVNPLRGVGAGSYVAALAVQGLESTQPVHNVPLLVSAELGILTGLLWIALSILPPIFTALNRHASRFEQALAVALLGCLITDQLDMYAWQWPAGRIIRMLLLVLWVVESERRELAT